MGGVRREEDHAVEGRHQVVQGQAAQGPEQAVRENVRGCGRAVGAALVGCGVGRRHAQTTPWRTRLLGALTAQTWPLVVAVLTRGQRECCTYWLGWWCLVVYKPL